MKFIPYLGSEIWDIVPKEIKKLESSNSFNPFHATGLFLYSLKISEPQTKTELSQMGPS